MNAHIYFMQFELGVWKQLPLMSRGSLMLIILDLNPILDCTIITTRNTMNNCYISHCIFRIFLMEFVLEFVVATCWTRIYLYEAYSFAVLEVPGSSLIICKRLTKGVVYMGTYTSVACRCIRVPYYSIMYYFIWVYEMIYYHCSAIVSFYITYNK